MQNFQENLEHSKQLTSNFRNVLLHANTENKRPTKYIPELENC